MRKVICLIGICLFTVGSVVIISRPRVLSLHLIHTNDLHAHLIPFHPDNRSCTDESEDCLGGFARIQTLIKKYKSRHPDAILLDAGDRFSGTIFYTLRKSQDLIPLMNKMGYDALTLGNHDFDSGLSELEKSIQTTQPPIVSANTIFPKDSLLARQIKSAHIIERNGYKIGIIGALTDDVKTKTTQAKEIQLAPLVETIQKEVDQLKNQGVTLIILLSHLGYDADQAIAARLLGLNIIVGGHTHTVLSNDPENKEAQGPYPTVRTGADGKPVLIVTGGWGGQYVGTLSADFDSSGNLVSYQGDSHLISHKIRPDSEMKQSIIEIEDLIKAETDKPIVRNPAPISLTGTSFFCTYGCPIGEVLTDALLKSDRSADIVFLNAGGIRSGLPQGQITFRHLAEAYPFDSGVVITTVPGKDIPAYITHGLKKFNTTRRTNAFLQTAGLSYTFDPQTKEITELLHQGKPLDLNKNYRVIMPSFMAEGGDGYPVIHKKEVIFESLRNQLVQVFQDPAYRFPMFENRIKLK